MTPHRAEKQIHGDFPDLAPNSEKRQWERPSCKIHEIKITLDSFRLALDRLCLEATHHVQDTFAFLLNKH